MSQHSKYSKSRPLANTVADVTRMASRRGKACNFDQSGMATELCTAKSRSRDIALEAQSTVLLLASAVCLFVFPVHVRDSACSENHELTVSSDSLV